MMRRSAIIFTGLLIAQFWLGENVIANTFVIRSVSTLGGKIVPSGKVTVNSGDTPGFTISPRTNAFELVGLTVDGAPVTLTDTYTFGPVTANHIIKASFKKRKFNITASAETGGRISPNGTVTVNYGASKAFIARPNKGSIASVFLDGVQVKQGKLNKPVGYSLKTIVADHAIEARFGADTTGSIPRTPIPLSTKWETNGPEGGMITSLAIDPKTPSLVYATTFSAGGFKSTDGGNSWKRIEIFQDGHVSRCFLSIQIDPINPANVYCDSGPLQLSSILRSSDSGETWKQLDITSSSSIFAIYRMVIDPLTPSTLYVLPYNENGVYKSMDYGETWHSVSNGLPKNVHIDSISIDPVNPSILIASPYQDGNYTESGDIYKTTDGGDNWVKMAGTLPQGSHVYLAMDQEQSSIIYGSEFLKGFYKSVDGGNSFELANNGMNYDAIVQFGLDPNSPSTLYAADPASLYRTTDRGEHWTLVGQTTLNDWAIPLPQAIVVEPYNPKVIYLASLDGVFKSTDGGIHWFDANYRLTAQSIRNVVVDPVTPTTVYATAGRIYKSTNSGGNWRRIYDGNIDIENVTIDPKNHKIIYGIKSRYSGDHALIKTTDGGETWFRPEEDLPTLSILCLAIDPVNTSIVYAGTEYGLFKSTNGGVNWRAIVSGQIDGFSKIRSIGIDPHGSGVVLVSMDKGMLANGLFRSMDNGSTWQQVDGLSEVKSITFNPVTPNTVYISAVIDNYPNYSAGPFISSDGGVTWTLMNNGLPERSWFSSFAININLPNTIYGMEYTGLYKTTDGGANWEKYGTGDTDLPFRADILATDSQSPPVLYAGSYGGVFRKWDK